MELEMSFGTVHADMYQQSGEVWVELSDEKVPDPYYNKVVKLSDLEKLVVACRSAPLPDEAATEEICLVCGLAVDTREVDEGGMPDGREVHNGWVCSSACWDSV